MLGKTVAFWVLWFMVTVVMGKLWPEGLDGGENKVFPISIPYGFIGALVTGLLVFVLHVLLAEPFWPFFSGSE